MNELGEIRKKKGLSYKELSKKCRVSACTISNYEKGKVKRPQAAVLEKVMKVLNSVPDIIKEKVNIKMGCLNENCLLNKNKQCNNEVVLEGRAPCFGKNEIKKKQNTISPWDNLIKKEFAKRSKNE